MRRRGEAEFDEPLDLESTGHFGRSVHEEGRGEHQQDHAIAACQGDSLLKDGSRLRKARPAPRLEVPLGEAICDEHAECEHRRARGDDRRRERGGPREPAEQDEAGGGTQLIESRARGQHAIDSLGRVEFVRQPGDIGPARERPREAPQHLRRHQRPEVGDQTGEQHARAHQEMRDDHGPLAADRVRDHTGRDFEGEGGELLRRADQHELER